MHAREFKRLVKAHGIADETIEGVKIGWIGALAIAEITGRTG